MIPGFKAAQAVGDHIIIRIHKREQTTGGLALPQTYEQSIPPYAEVMSIGEDAATKLPSLKVGDFVQGRTGSYQSIYMEEGEWYICRAEHIVAVVELGEQMARQQTIAEEMKSGWSLEGRA